LEETPLRIVRGRLAAFAALICVAAAPAKDASPPGRFVDLGGWRVYLDCEGRGAPTVVVETGLGDYARDWVLVQERVERTTRICIFDRAGYGFSDPGPMPRTYDQENLDLHRALAATGEHGPFVLVGHSYGGPLARNFAHNYPAEVAGMVLAESSTENGQVQMGPGKFARLSDLATDTPPPAPRLSPVLPARHVKAPAAGADPAKLEAVFHVLPDREQRWHAWMDAQPSLQEALQSERQWSPYYLRAMTRTPQAGSLGDRPLVVLTRAESGYERVPPPLGPQLEQERQEQQAALAKLSSRGVQRIVAGGHNLHLTAPGAVADAIAEVVQDVRARRR
jgi:pimeloyl-ACP methyl ester carboxylesterase